MNTSLLSIGQLSNERPQTIIDLNNGQGTFLYVHNIKEVFVIQEDEILTLTEDEEIATGVMYQFDSVRCEYPRTGDNIFATLIASKYPPNVQSKFVNEYQSAVLGILDESYQDNYRLFLEDRISIKSMIDADCVSLNLVPTNL